MTTASTDSKGESAHEKRRRYNQTVAALSRLSDFRLSDIGVSRKNIRAVAHEAVYGR